MTSTYYYSSLIHHVKHTQIFGFPSLCVMLQTACNCESNTLETTLYFIFVMAEIFQISVVGIPLKHSSAFVFDNLFLTNPLSLKVNITSSRAYSVSTNNQNKNYTHCFHITALCRIIIRLTKSIPYIPPISKTLHIRYFLMAYFCFCSRVVIDLCLTNHDKVTHGSESLLSHLISCLDHTEQYKLIHKSVIALVEVLL